MEMNELIRKLENQLVVLSVYQNMVDEDLDTLGSGFTEDIAVSGGTISKPTEAAAIQNTYLCSVWRNAEKELFKATDQIQAKINILTDLLFDKEAA